MKPQSDKNGIARELRSIVHRGRKVWRLVPRRRKLALGGAALIMALTSAGNTALPLLLGRLVDSILSERHVQRAMGLTRGDRTTILVAHRLSTLRDADRILVFNDGRIVEIGAYDALVQKGGMFAQLVMSAENGIGAA